MMKGKLTECFAVSETPVILLRNAFDFPDLCEPRMDTFSKCLLLFNVPMGCIARLAIYIVVYTYGG